MAYIALYRKWRPKTFEDVVGQRQITETLQKAIDTDKVAHAYLFSGPRGTGKTSTAKIFARAMNCVHGPTSHPCNTCDVCRHILAGESLDVIEIDAASNRSIEDIRNLRETIKFMPAEGRKKIYIIDEVHMLTTEAFNALLKTLEEPPAHVIFILATTEPEKIPMTILSRCQRYEFRRITSQDIAERILYIADKEHIDISKGAAHILSVQADGGMRDALSLLDQCVSNADGTIDETLVRNLLGLVGRDWLFSLADAVFSHKGDVIISAVDDIVRMGKEPRVILTELLEHLRALMLYQAAPESDTLSAYADSMKELAEQAGRVEPGQVFRILGVLQEALMTAKNSPAPRVAVEMGLLMASQVGSTSTHAVSDTSAGAAQIQALTDRVTRLEQALCQIRVPAGSTKKEREE
uniref:DNA polymerase III subunit gamma/tau n=1 Tax=Megasphaera sp. DJF_B143 TaxID=537288 RepID=UPI0012432721